MKIRATTNDSEAKATKIEIITVDRVTITTIGGAVVDADSEIGWVM